VTTPPASKEYHVDRLRVRAALLRCTGVTVTAGRGTIRVQGQTPVGRPGPARDSGYRRGGPCGRTGSADSDSARPGTLTLTLTVTRGLTRSLRLAMIMMIVT
jgi:hypothetical protein